MARVTKDATAIIPDETLSLIFTFLRSIDPVTYRERSPTQPKSCGAFTAAHNRSFGWVNVTFVNRRWRHVAINNGTLWTNLTNFLGPHWLNEMVRRSKSAPLDIDNNNFSSAWKQVNQPLRAVLTLFNARISCLWLRTPTMDVFNQTFSVRMDSLQEFSLALDRRISACPLANLLDRAPLLRSLRLDLPELSYAPWGHSALNNITSLNLILQSTKTGILMPELLNALSRMHYLSELSLKELHVGTPNLSCSHRCSATPDDLIILNSMKSMIVDSPLETHAHILRHIRVPSHTRLALVSPNTVTPETCSSSKIAFVHEALAHELGPFMRSYAVKPMFHSAYLNFESNWNGVTASLGLSRQAHPERPIPGVLLCSKHPHATLTNDFTVHFHDAQAPIILPLLPLPTIRALTVLDAGISLARAHLAFFPGVQRLRLCVSQLNSLYGISFLEDTAVLPNLRVLDTDANVFVLRTVLMCFTSHGLHVVPERFPALENVFEARRQTATPIEAIYLHVEEEIALVKQGRIAETSCKKLREDIVRESIRRLEGVYGVQIVRKDFDVFSL
ncbi:unnamed protein product [Peniophora sp. CBMAI 1063]|nr:unnamed protein product [Peniophora sp. CBMAI 1063]